MSYRSAVRHFYFTDSKKTKLSKGYWRKLKHDLKEEGSQIVTDCNALKLPGRGGEARHKSQK